MITKVRTRRRKFQLSEMNSEMREINFGLRELKFGLREINLSCEVLDSQSHRKNGFFSSPLSLVVVVVNSVRKKIQIRAENYKFVLLLHGITNDSKTEA